MEDVAAVFGGGRLSNRRREVSEKMSPKFESPICHQKFLTEINDKLQQTSPHKFPSLESSVEGAVGVVRHKHNDPHFVTPIAKFSPHLGTFAFSQACAK